MHHFFSLKSRIRYIFDALAKVYFSIVCCVSVKHNISHDDMMI